MTARSALKIGMIDGVSTTIKASGKKPKSYDKGKNAMNREELKTQHAALYAECLKIGAQQEQERVSAFIELGQASGANDLAMQCIKDGTEHSATVTAKFSAEHMKAQAVKAMIEDNPVADAKPKAAEEKTEAQKLDEAIAQKFDESNDEVRFF